MFRGPRPAGREHIPIYPLVYRIIRLLIALFSITTLALSSYAYSLLPFSAAAFNIFTSVASLLTAAYFAATIFYVPAYFNYWVLLVLDILIPIMCISSSGYLVYQIGMLNDTIVPYTDTGRCYWAAIGLSIACFGLYFITFIFDIITLSFHRSAGFHSVPRADPEKTSSAAAAASLSSPSMRNPTAVPLLDGTPLAFYELQAPTTTAAPIPSAHYPPRQQEVQHYYEVAAAPVPPQYSKRVGSPV